MFHKDKAKTLREVEVGITNFVKKKKILAINGWTSCQSTPFRGHVNISCWSYRPNCIDRQWCPYWETCAFFELSSRVSTYPANCTIVP